MIGRIKDLTGSTTPALYVIAVLCVACAAILLFAGSARLRRRDSAD